MNIKFNAFETKHLGLKSGKVFYSASEIETLEPSMVYRLAEEAKNKEYNLVSLRIQAPDDSIARVFESAGFRKVEDMLSYSRKISQSAKGSNAVRVARKDDIEYISQIGESSFSFDRFHSDPLIDNDKADKLKRAWSRNCLTHRASKVFVFQDEKVGGFLACVKTKYALVIDLIAVAEEKRGLGVGRDLIGACEEYYQEQCNVYSVSTQSSNKASINLYNSCGFQLVSKKATFHLVIK
jgi:ribosomal protein S18 acetylase RimI-like enzyme